MVTEQIHMDKTNKSQFSWKKNIFNLFILSQKNLNN